MAEPEDPNDKEETEGLSADDDLLELDASDLGLDDEEENQVDSQTEAAAEEGAEGAEAEADPTDLEAFLEDFEQQQMQEVAAGLQEEPEADAAEASPAEPEEDLEEAAAQAEAEEVPEPDAGAESEEPLPAEELDLSFGEEEDEATPAAEPTAEPDESGAAVAAAAAAASAPEPPQPPPAPAPEVPLASEEPVPRDGGAKAIVVPALAVLALAAAIGSGVFSYAVEGRVASLAATVRVLQEDRTATPAASAALQGEVDRLDARIQELATLVEGPMSHLNDSRQEAVGRLQARVEELEGRLSGVREAISAVQQRVGRLAESGGAGQSPGGAWSVNLASFRNEDAADQALGELRASGVRAEKQRVTSDGRTWYRLRVTGFGSQREAEAYGRKVEAETGMRDTWVSKG